MSRGLLKISKLVSIPETEVEFQTIRAQGPGGQNVNKVAAAVHLRFDITASSLPAYYKERLLQSTDQRISKEGVVTIKAQSFRSQQRNKEDALIRLKTLIKQASIEKKKRKPTHPSRGSQEKRLAVKAKKSRLKALRGKIEAE